jgi:hypothetical protein
LEEDFHKRKKPSSELSNKNKTIEFHCSIKEQRNENKYLQKKYKVLSFSGFYSGTK